MARCSSCSLWMYHYISEPPLIFTSSARKKKNYEAHLAIELYLNCIHFRFCSGCLFPQFSIRRSSMFVLFIKPVITCFVWNSNKSCTMPNQSSIYRPRVMGTCIHLTPSVYFVFQPSSIHLYRSQMVTYNRPICPSQVEPTKCSHSVSTIWFELKPSKQVCWFKFWNWFLYFSFDFAVYLVFVLIGRWKNK